MRNYRSSLPIRTSTARCFQALTKSLFPQTFSFHIHTKPWGVPSSFGALGLPSAEFAMCFQ